LKDPPKTRTRSRSISNTIKSEDDVYPILTTQSVPPPVVSNDPPNDNIPIVIQTGVLLDNNRKTRPKHAPLTSSKRKRAKSALFSSNSNNLVQLDD